MAFFEGTFLWEVSVHSNSGQGATPTPPPPKWACSQKSGDDFSGGLSVQTIFAQKIPSKIVFCFWSAFYNAEQNKSNVSSIQAIKRNIPAKNTPAKIHSVPRWTIKKKTIFTASDQPCDFSRDFYFVTWQKAILVWWKKLHKKYSSEGVSFSSSMAAVTSKYSKTIWPLYYGE